MEFAEAIENERVKQYDNPKSFWRICKLTFSYAHYLAIEKGEKIPSCNNALEIIEKLGLSKYDLLKKWVRDQLPEKDKNLFPEPTKYEGQIGLHSLANASSDILIINKFHLPLLNKNAIYWDILSYLAAVSADESKRTLSEISHVFGLSKQDMLEHLKKLLEKGLAFKEGHYFTVMPSISIPYSDEYNEIRDQNFKRAFQNFWSNEDERKRFRTTHVRSLTPSQVDILKDKVYHFLNSVASIPDEQGGTPYSIGLFFSKRRYKC